MQYIYILYLFIILINILKSTSEICIIVETMQDIGAVQLFTLSYICPKHFVLSILTPRPLCYFQQRIIIFSS